jgi:hypothetical protein
MRRVLALYGTQHRKMSVTLCAPKLTRELTIPRSANNPPCPITKPPLHLLPSGLPSCPHLDRSSVLGFWSGCSLFAIGPIRDLGPGVTRRASGEARIRRPLPSRAKRSCSSG